MGTIFKVGTMYKGFTYTDVTTRTDDGRYIARVAIMALDGSRTRSQRFIDLETYPTRDAAHDRVDAVARAWIDANLDPERLGLPSRFSPLA